MKALTRAKVEDIVIGTLLNEVGDDRFYERNKASLRKDLFKSKRNAFVFGVIEQMMKDGLTQTTPYDVMNYCNEKGTAYGNAANFAVYMCGLSTDYYAFKSFKNYVRELVQYYLRDRKNG